MALADISSRDAVLDAIDEYEAVGEKEFARRYSGGATSALTIEYIGQRFAAVPTINLAHRIMHGGFLTAAELREEAAVRRQLGFLGFTVIPPAEPPARSGSTRTRRAAASAGGAPAGGRPGAPPTSSAARPPRVVNWDLSPGAVLTRGQITAAYGGSNVGAVVESPRTASVLIFNDAAQGGRPGMALHGWDAAQDGVYHVTGAGRGHSNGPATDHIMQDPIMRAAQAGKTLRVFETVDEPLRPGGRRQRYVGAFEVDPDLPWRIETAHDARGNPRALVVYRLLAMPDTARGHTTDA